MEIAGLLGMWIDRYGPPEPDRPPVYTLNCYYHARIADDARVRVDPSEALDAGWFAPAEIPWDHLAFPDHTVPMLRAWRDVMATDATGTGVSRMPDDPRRSE